MEVYLSIRPALSWRVSNKKKGVHFDEIFAPIVKMTSIPTVLSMAASMNLEIEQLDVKTTFLHMVNWKRKSICNCRRALRWKEKRILYVGWGRACMDLNKLLDNGIRSLDPLCWNMDSTKHKPIIVYLWKGIMKVIILFFCCMWMICWLLGKMLKRLQAWRKYWANLLPWKTSDQQNRFWECIVCRST